MKAVFYTTDTHRHPRPALGPGLSSIAFVLFSIECCVVQCWSVGVAYRQLGVAVHLEPVGADQVLLVEHGVVRAQEVEVLELKILSYSAYKYRQSISQRENDR